MQPFDMTAQSREIQPVLDVLNQVFEIEKKVQKLSEENSIHRNLRKLRSRFEEGYPLAIGQSLVRAGLTYQDPTGEPYDETRTDCEASIAGGSAENLRIVETIKPIIRLQHGAVSLIVQRAVVVVSSEQDHEDDSA
jgi:hypothetical protein